jgi:hypothetical protein
MRTLFRSFVVALLLFVSVATFAEDVIYKSVDETGAVTYSAEPPAGGVASEAVPLPAPPSEAATREAVERAERMKQDADAGYEALMEQRHHQVEADQAAKAAAEAAERQRRIDEALEQREAEPEYYPVYPPDWRRPFPPRPPIPHPPHPPHLPKPPHPPAPLVPR